MRHAAGQQPSTCRWVPECAMTPACDQAAPTLPTAPSNVRRPCGAPQIPAAPRLSLTQPHSFPPAGTSCRESPWAAPVNYPPNTVHEPQIHKGNAQWKVRARCTLRCAPPPDLYVVGGLVELEGVLERDDVRVEVEGGVAQLRKAQRPVVLGVVKRPAAAACAITLLRNRSRNGLRAEVPAAPHSPILPSWALRPWGAALIASLAVQMLNTTRSRLLPGAPHCRPGGRAACPQRRGRHAAAAAEAGDA